MMYFLMIFVAFICITRACERWKLLLLSNDTHLSRKRGRKREGLGRKSLALTNQQGGTGDKRDSIDYFSLKKVTWGRDCLVTKDHSIFSVLCQQLCSSLLPLLWSKYAQLVFSQIHAQGLRGQHIPCIPHSFVLLFLDAAGKSNRENDKSGLENIPYR